MKFDFIQFGQWSPNLNSKQSEIDGSIKLAYFTWTNRRIDDPQCGPRSGKQTTYFRLFSRKQSE